MEAKYRLYDQDDYQGIYTAKELAEMLGCPVRTASTYAYSGAKYRKRWHFEKEEELDEEWKRAWEAEREQERKRVLRGNIK